MVTDPAYLRAMYDRLDALYAPFAARGDGLLPEHDIVSLRVVLRLVVEVVDFIERRGTPTLGAFETSYLCESVFSGISSFSQVVESYIFVAGAPLSKVSSLEWSIDSMASQIPRLFAKFCDSNDFLEQCRLILDSFKLCIAMAGLLY